MEENDQNTGHVSSKSVSSEISSWTSPRIATVPACHRAMSNFLILSNVFPFIENDFTCLFYKEEMPDDAALKSGVSDSYTQYGVLLRCCLVSKLWWSAAAPFIWRDVMKDDLPQRSISERLYQVPDDATVDGVSRRQYYANFIEIGMEKIQDQDYLHNNPTYNTKRDNLFRSLMFSRLTILDIRYVVGSSYPALDSKSAPSLVNISWSIPAYDWGHDECLYGDPQMDVQNMLEWISESFPNMEVVEIRGYGRAFPGYLDKFKKKMKNLKTFEHQLEEEESYYPRRPEYR